MVGRCPTGMVFQLAVRLGLGSRWARACTDSASISSRRAASTSGADRHTAADRARSSKASTGVVSRVRSAARARTAGIWGIAGAAPDPLHPACRAGSGPSPRNAQAGGAGGPWNSAQRGKWQRRARPITRAAVGGRGTGSGSIGGESDRIVQSGPAPIRSESSPSPSPSPNLLRPRRPMTGLRGISGRLSSLSADAPYPRSLRYSVFRSSPSTCAARVRLPPTASSTRRM